MQVEGECERECVWVGGCECECECVVGGGVFVVGSGALGKCLAVVRSLSLRELAKKSPARLVALAHSLAHSLARLLACSLARWLFCVCAFVFRRSL